MEDKMNFIIQNHMLHLMSMMTFYFTADNDYKLAVRKWELY